MSQWGVFAEVSKLVGTGTIGKAYQGIRVKLSEDGNFLFVGGERDNNYIGAVWFYQKINGVWTQIQKIVPTGYSGTQPLFGISIAVNPSMTTLIIGAYNTGGYVGATFVFTFDDTMWSQHDKLVGNGVTGTLGSQQGWTVALSSDASTAIVGGPQDENYVGAAWIFVRTNNTWSQQGSKLVGTGYFGSSYQGSTVSLTSNGNLAVVGAYYDQSGIGALWVYFRSNTSWSQVGTKITATGEVGAGLFSLSLALSGDDQTLVVGGHGDDSSTGATWIFKRNGNTFTQFGNKLVATGATPTSHQGFSVAVNKLGTLVAVSAPADSSGTGAVFMYYFNGTQFNQLENKIAATDAIGTAWQGYSVSFDGSGSQLLCGGPFDNGNIGAAWIFKNATITSAPTEQPSLDPTTQPSVEPTTQPAGQVSLKPTASALSLQGSSLEVGTITIVAAGVGAALVVVLAYFFYRYRANNKYTTNKVTEISQWIADSKGTRAADIQIQETEKNEDNFMAMTDIYEGNNDNDQNGGDANFDSRVLI